MKDKDRYKTRHVWYLGEAQTLIREIQAIMWPLNYHVALGGGVLNHGYSNSDLDLYILPLNKHAQFKDAADAIAGMLTYDRPISGNPRYHSMAPAIEAADVYTYNGKRVDVFFLRAHCEVCHVADRLLGE